jgi:hypothetical protein
VKAILLVAGLLGACGFSAADLASDTFLKIRLENYFRNPLEFPEPGFDIIAAAEPLRDEQMRKVVAPEPQTELMRGDTWRALQPGRNDGEQPNGTALWWLVSTTVICLAFGACLSAAQPASTHRKRRRVKRVRRMMAGC